jgi:hypothetical protein
MKLSWVEVARVQQAALGLSHGPVASAYNLTLDAHRLLAVSRCGVGNRFTNPITEVENELKKRGIE